MASLKVVFSGTEAEYIAGSTVCNLLVRITQTIHFLAYSKSNTRLYVDNKSAICIASNSKDDRSTRHIYGRHQLIKGLVSTKQIDRKHISVKNNPAETISETIRIFLSSCNILMRC